MEPISPDTLLDLLRQHSKAYTQTGLAHRIGCSKSYLNDVLAGRRSIGPRILRYMRLERSMTYRTITPDPADER